MNNPSIDICRVLEGWYATPRGQYVLAATRQLLAPVLDVAFGYHLLQIGGVRESVFHQSSPIHHRIHLAAEPGNEVAVVGKVDELPFCEDSVDMLIAHHALEFAEDPHRALREMQRVLAPSGQLLIVGFNPFSVQGLSNLVRGRFHQPLWRTQHLLSKRRVCDWLSLVGCEVESVRYIYTVPPCGRGGLRSGLINVDERLSRYNLPVGGIYVIHAIKQTYGISRPRPLLKSRRSALIGLVPKPAASSHSAARHKTRSSTV